MGLVGFGIALVSLALLPFIMSPVTAVVLMTVYALVFAVGMAVQLRRDLVPAALRDLFIGTVTGTPLGVWVLASLPVATLNRLIGAMLLVAVLLEWAGRYPQTLPGRRWAPGAGVLAGVVGAAVGTPGPPVIVYASTQGWSPRTIKANLQAFFVVNQGVILVGYWWAGLLTAEVWALTVAFAGPAAVGGLAGVALFSRIDAAAFRRIVFALLFVSGLVLLVRG
jgi:uncharacterized membrane protein YfcA